MELLLETQFSFDLAIGEGFRLKYRVTRIFPECLQTVGNEAAFKSHRVTTRYYLILTFRIHCLNTTLL